MRKWIIALMVLMMAAVAFAQGPTSVPPAVVSAVTYSNATKKIFSPPVDDLAKSNGLLQVQGPDRASPHRLRSVDPSDFAHANDLSVVGEDSYPVLVLSLGGAWTDFELKASTNNFASTNGLVYYLISSATNSYADDTNAWVYFTDDYDTEKPHKWRTATNATPISGQLLNTNSVVDYVVVYPSHNCQKNWQDWMCITNTSLVWSFVRFDGADFEKNVSGTAQHWNLVVPQWRKKRTGPNGETDP